MQKEVEHFITIDASIERTSKPTLEEITYIYKNLNRLCITEVKDLNYCVVNNGYTWSPAIFKDNKRNNENWISQSIFVLDFDDGITPEKVLNRFKEYNLYPNLLYSTFSDSKELRKFRFVLFLNETISNKKESKFIQDGLMLMYPECDTQCNDYARMYYGGKETIYQNETLINKDKLKDILNTFIISKNIKRGNNILYGIDNFKNKNKYYKPVPYIVNNKVPVYNNSINKLLNLNLIKSNIKSKY